MWPMRNAAVPIDRRRRRSATAVIVAWLAASVVGCRSASTAISEPSGSKCQVTVTNSLALVPASGGSGTLTVTTARDCTWVVSSGAAWLTVLSGSSGQGDGVSSYRAAANTAADPRRGTLAVNDTDVTLVQDAPCAFTVTPAAFAAPAEGLAGQVRLATANACEWVTTTDVEWLRIEPGGRGPRTLTLTVSANSGGSRRGQVVVAGETIAVVQEGAAPVPVPGPGPPALCRYELAPTGLPVPNGGGLGTFEVLVATGCRWTAQPSADWITVVAGGSGAGAGAVSFQAAPKSGSGGRVGTIRVGDQTFTITQGTP